MTQRYRLYLTCLSASSMILIGWSTTGSFDFLTQHFWFVSGGLLLVVLALVDQPHFSKDANVFVNGLTGLVSLSPVPPVWRDALWWIFLAWTLYLILSSTWLMRVRQRSLKEEGRGVQVLSRINRAIGRPEALFSAFLLWGALRQFQFPGPGVNAVFLFWAAFMVFNLPAVALALEAWTRGPDTASEVSEGAVIGFVSPNIAEVEMDSRQPLLTPGTGIALVDAATPREYAEGRVVDDRVLLGTRVARVAIGELKEGWQVLAQAGSVRVVIRERTTDGALVGVVEAGSDIGTLIFRVHPSAALREGALVSVTSADGQPGFYQVVGATVEQAPSREDNSVLRIRVEAGQLGNWDQQHCRFDPLPWVPPPGAVVSLHQGGEHPEPLPAGHVSVGRVPQSAFAVHVDLQDLVTHNGAILGITGSGKSYLAMALVEAMIDGGIRVLVLDISRQYAPFLKHLAPVAIVNNGDVDAWLASDSRLGVIQFDNLKKDGGLPKATADIASKALAHVSTQDPTPGVDRPAQLCLVLEEAHALIPEWNQVAQKGDEQFVNHTARVVLQGRKYGMGCLVITQRTANVTKTILNQCNTIFALQSFDQTGLDFLRNYLGEAYARAISTLPRLHGVLVGRASSSGRPIIFHVEDMVGRWPRPDVAEKPADMPPPQGDPNRTG